MKAQIIRELNRISTLETGVSLEELLITIKSMTGQFDGVLRSLKVSNPEIKADIILKVESWMGVEDIVFDLMEDIRLIPSYKLKVVKDGLNKMLENEK